MKRRVVITGMGGLSPYRKHGAGDVGKCQKQVCGIDTIKSFDTENHKVKVAGELKNYNPEDYMDKMQARRTARFTQFALIAAREAMACSGLSMETEECGQMRRQHFQWNRRTARLLKKNIAKASRGFDRVSPLFVPMAILIWRQAW